MDRMRAFNGEDVLDCPVLCNCVIFALIALFILYLPFGDPQIECSNVEHDTLTACCLCNFYMHIIRFLHHVITIFDLIICTILNAYDEAKLKILGIQEYLCSIVIRITLSSRKEDENVKEATRTSTKLAMFKNCFKSKPDKEFAEDTKVKVTYDDPKKNVESDNKMKSSFFKTKSKKLKSCAKCEAVGTVCPSECDFKK